MGFFSDAELSSMRQILEQVAETARLYQTARPLLDQVADTAELYQTGLTQIAIARQLAGAATLLQPTFNYLESRVSSTPAPSEAVAPNVAILEDASPSISEVPEEVRATKRMSDKEFAAWLSVIVFLFVCFGLAVASQFDSLAAQISTATGATPYEIALPLAGLVFAVAKEHRK